MEGSIDMSLRYLQFFSLQRHFYLAVDRPQFKMVVLKHCFEFLKFFSFVCLIIAECVQNLSKNEQETLTDLLGLVGRRPCLPIVVCCSSRDELDSVCSNISNLSSRISISSLVGSFFFFFFQWFEFFGLDWI